MKITDYAHLGDYIQYLEVSAEKLGLKDVELVVTNKDSILDSLGANVGKIDAILYKNTSGIPVYNLVLRSVTSQSLPLVLCHEMIHLQQYLSGTLSFDLDKKEFIWKGVKFPFSHDYNERPWEQEAYFKQHSLFAECKKVIKTKPCFLSKIFKKNK